MSSFDIQEKIKRTFKNIEFHDRHSDDQLCLEFSTSKKKDYTFYLWIESLWTTLNIGASLKGNPDKYFWYDSAEKLNMGDEEWVNWAEEYIFRTLDKLVNYETRIIQKDGLVFTSFTCEYFDNEWKELTKNRGFRWTLDTPKIKGQKKVYV